MVPLHPCAVLPSNPILLLLWQLSQLFPHHKHPKRSCALGKSLGWLLLLALSKTFDFTPSVDAVNKVKGSLSLSLQEGH